MHAQSDQTHIPAAAVGRRQPPAAIRTVDATGSHCPGPLQELIRLIREADVGETVGVLADDPAAHESIPAWVAKAGYRLIGIENTPAGSRFVVTRTR